MSAARRGEGRVLLLEADAERRMFLANHLRAAGMCVRAARRISEIKRWPAGEVVVTDAARFTAWWKFVGATHVVVLVETPEEGIHACARGASVWLPRTCSPGVLIETLRNLAINDSLRLGRDK
jgi:hypothetical protein